jgi:hypothetical protein
MAFTTSGLMNTVLGNKRVLGLRVTADAATDAFETGLGVIDFVSVAYQSATTGAGKFKINALSAGTAANGYLAVTGVASGDVFFVTVYGH